MLIVIEGIDGSGKGTITKGLTASLLAAGLKVDQLSFPRYETNSYGKLVGRYLNGDFGSDTHPYLHGTLYSLDRFESKPYLEASIQFNDVVVLDRYVASNLCYSAMKTEGEERDEIVKHFVQLEYVTMKMPVPDIIFFLDVPVKYALQNIALKETRKYTDKDADIHEADVDFLQKVRTFYMSELMKYHPPTRYESVECVRSGHLLSIEVIVEKVHSVVCQMLKGC